MGEVRCEPPSLRWLVRKAPHLFGLRVLPCPEKPEKVRSSAQTTREATRTFKFIKSHQPGLAFSFQTCSPPFQSMTPSSIQTQNHPNPSSPSSFSITSPTPISDLKHLMRPFCYQDLDQSTITSPLDFTTAS